MNDVTFIIKTFERPECIKRLVKSIYKYYKDAIVLIGDDSKISCKKYIEQKYYDKNIKVYELPKDCGLSYGRNYLLNEVKTKYFVLLDDDFMFDKKTNIEEALEIINNKNIDILGGFIRNYKIVHSIFDRIIVLGQLVFRYELASNYIGKIRQNGKTLFVDYEKFRFPDYEEVDLVMNFFIAKTESVLRSKWDDDLKLQEHTAFFYKAQLNGLKVAFTNKLSIRHMPVQLKAYSSFRGRNFSKIFMEKNNIDKIISTYDGGPEQIQVISND